MIWIKRLISTLRSPSADEQLQREFASHLGALKKNTGNRE